MEKHWWSNHVGKRARAAKRPLAARRRVATADLFCRAPLDRTTALTLDYTAMDNCSPSQVRPARVDEEDQPAGALARATMRGDSRGRSSLVSLIFSPAEAATRSAAAASAGASSPPTAASTSGRTGTEGSGSSGSSGGSGSGTGGASVATAPQPSPPAQKQEEDDIWESSKPVERRSEALTDELHDCLGLFWSWVTCGGPGARVRQLYVNGRLSRCADEWTRLRTCAAIRAASASSPLSALSGGEGGGDDKKSREVDVVINPGPHPVWRIRSRKEAGAFWRENYAHLGAGAVPNGGGGGGNSGGKREESGA